MASNNEYRIPSLIEKELRRIDESINKFKYELSMIGLQYKQTDSVVKLINSFIDDNRKSILLLLENTTTKSGKIVDDVLGYSQKQLLSMDSHYKRYIKLFFQMQIDGVHSHIIRFCTSSMFYERHMIFMFVISFFLKVKDDEHV